MISIKSNVLLRSFKLLVLLSFFQLNLYSQQNFLLYSMNSVPQSVNVNPSVMPEGTINVGVPILSSIYANWGFNGFNLNDVFSSNGATTNLLIGDAINNMGQNNFMTFNFHLELLSFGFKVKKNYFSFNVTEKADVGLRLPKDFFNLIWNGNGALLGQTLNLNFGVNATHYREYGFGFNRELDKKWSVGGRFKLLDGEENISTAKSDVKFYTDPNDFSYKASSDVKLNSSMDTSMGHSFNASSYFMGFKNAGMAIDLGASYKVNEKITVAASLIDLGFINWTNGVTNFQSQNPGASFVFSGMTFKGLGLDSIQGGKSLNKLTDSLKKTFNITTTHNNYKSYLPAQLYLSGSYKLNDVNIATLLLYSQFMQGAMRPGLTLSVSSKVGKAVRSSVSYSMFNGNYGIVGFGLSLNAGPVQIYMIADDIFAFLFYDQYNSGNSSIELPANTRFFNFRTGLNLTFGRDKDKKADNPSF